MTAFSKFLALILSLTSTWGGFEMYHQMRMEDFLTLNSIFYAVASVGLVLLGGIFARLGAQIQ